MMPCQVQTDSAVCWTFKGLRAVREATCVGPSCDLPERTSGFWVQEPGIPSSGSSEVLFPRGPGVMW